MLLRARSKKRFGKCFPHRASRQDVPRDDNNTPESRTKSSPKSGRKFKVMVTCPICERAVKAVDINNHIDSGCQNFLAETTTTAEASSSSNSQPNGKPNGTQSQPGSTQKKRTAATFFQTPSAKRQAGVSGGGLITSVPVNGSRNPSNANTPVQIAGTKRSFGEGPGNSSPTEGRRDVNGADAVASANGDTKTETTSPSTGQVVKRTKTNRAAPLAERMRPQNLDDVFGQDLVGPNGVLRGLIESGRVPSMILWGGSGTGKTTIARCIAQKVGGRFIELNATSTGVAEVKKFFTEAANDLAMFNRRTIIFCDEIHRFSKSQQDVFLKPVEAGTITLIGATTENPSFKVQAALLSRCRTFTLATLTRDDIQKILLRALQYQIDNEDLDLSPLIDEELLQYLSAFADGDARTALNLLELALSLTTNKSTSPDTPSTLTKEDIKQALTKTLVYDRAGDQHYDTISAFHKSVRGNDPDAALYYLARMLQSGEDPLFIARRMVVIASEDVGLADNTLLPLATATYTATQQIGMPEARIPLAHCCVALCLAKKSTRAYRALNNAFSALQEPGVASLPVPLHLRNAPTRLMKDLGFGAEYKYPPNYRDGKVRQEYLPSQLKGRRFLEDRDLGTEVDGDVEMDI
ncbi:putative AAA family ATPase [Rhypophila sp. PSN 637]